MNFKMNKLGALSASSALIAIIILGTTMTMMENDTIRQYNYSDISTIATQKAWINAYALAGKAVSDALTDQAYVQMARTAGNDCNTLLASNTSPEIALYKAKVGEYANAAINSMENQVSCSVKNTVVSAEALNQISQPQFNASPSSLAETSATGSADVKATFVISCSNLGTATYERQVTFLKRISFYRVVAKNNPPAGSSKYYYVHNSPNSQLTTLYSTAYKSSHGLGSSYYSIADFNALTNASVETKCFVGATDIQTGAEDIAIANSSGNERNAVACRHESDAYPAVYPESANTAAWSGSKYYGQASCTDGTANLNCDFTKTVLPPVPGASLSCQYKINEAKSFLTSYSAFSLPFTGILCNYRDACDNLSATIDNGPFNIKVNTNFTMQGSGHNGDPITAPNPYTYLWEFAGSNPLNCAFVAPSTSASQNPTIKCAKGGSAAVNFYVTDAKKTVSASGTVNSVSSNCAISPTNPSIYSGQTQQFTITNTASQSTWKSSDSGIASVDSVGLATGVSGGTSTITASANSGCNPTGPYSTTLTVVSSPAVPANLAAALGNAQVSLKWTAVANSASYKVE
ncbi:MAG: Ig-like domain-containing protein, partial [archaeon]